LGENGDSGGDVKLQLTRQQNSV